MCHKKISQKAFFHEKLLAHLQKKIVNISQARPFFHQKCGCNSKGAIIIKSIKFKSSNDVLKVEQIDLSQENRFHETSEVRQKGISRHYFGKQTIEVR